MKPKQSLMMILPDPDHSEDEERFILLGMSYTLQILTVVHCYRDNDGEIRIISARASTKNEERQYKEFLPLEKNTIFHNPSKTLMLKRSKSKSHSMWMLIRLNILKSWQ